MSVFIALAVAVRALDLAAARPVASPTENRNVQSAESNPDADKLGRAVSLVKAGRQADGIKLLDEIITTFEARYAEDRQLFCSRSMPESVVYVGLGMKTKKAATVLDQTWCYSYFYKGFALIDLNRGDEAKPYFDKAITLAPMNSQFLGERGEWYKSRRDWAHALADFESAAGYAELSPESMKSFEQRRAWRGMAFVRVEQGKLDEAEKLLRKCVELDPTDGKAKQELQYVASLRRKPV
ncbi:MAG: tetratricopeptide repeat protein [Vicinamibacterales bacterium]